jgi:nucleotide-binding universal stress UspA family protein
MYSKILVPLDGSKLSEAILPYARSLAKGLQIPVELLLAIEPEVISTFSDPKHGRYVDTVETDMKRNGVDYLEKVARTFPDASAVACSAVIGTPAPTIVERASEGRDTLIAMSTHGRSGIKRWILGSVADKVLHAASNHLLLVRSTNKTGETPQETALKTVIIPLDGSHLAESVLPGVTALARKMKMEVVLLRAYAMATQAYFIEAEAYMPDLDRFAEEVKKGAAQYLEEKVKQLQWEGLDKVSYILPQGDAAEEIIGLARETPDNLVAMCTHGRSGVGRWVLGSVTDRVVRYCGDPVLVVRTPEPS